MNSNFEKKTDPLYNDGQSINSTYSSTHEHGSVPTSSSDSDWKASAQNLYTDVSHLIAREGDLIRSEIGDKATQIKAALGAVAAGGAALFVGLLCVAATAIILLAYVVPLWASSVIVTAAFLIIGGVMLAGAKKKLEPDQLKLNNSMEAFSEIRHSLKEKVNEITKH